MHVSQSEIWLLAYFVTMQQECGSTCCSCLKAAPGAVKECFARVQMLMQRNRGSRVLALDNCGSSAQSAATRLRLGFGVTGHLLQRMMDLDGFAALFADESIDRVKPRKGEEGSAARTRGAGDAIGRRVRNLRPIARTAATRREVQSFLDRDNTTKVRRKG